MEVSVELHTPDHVVICLTTLSDGIAPNVWLILWNESERACEESVSTFAESFA